VALDHSRLEHVHDSGSKKLARCPACAALGHDNRGLHLILYPDGRFGCAAYPADPEHRRLIWKLAGSATDSKTAVRPVREKIWRGCRSQVSALLGRFGRVLPKPPHAMSGGTNRIAVQERVQNTRPTRPKWETPTRPVLSPTTHVQAAFVPLDLAWIDVVRYRTADAVEWPSRLDLFHEDPSGPWIRQHGVLIAISVRIPHRSDFGNWVGCE
jgi:hypothetical protein